jgi:hypothetical protein
MMVRQLEGKKVYGSKAVILCSEDTRIHLETRAFAKRHETVDLVVANPRSEYERLAEARYQAVHLHTREPLPGSFPCNFLTITLQ